MFSQSPKYFSGIAFLLAFSSLIAAQSSDLTKPTPLGPGVNKGNLTNQGSPHIYYFIGGPGKFDIHFAFHEMGMFGNPFRQVMNFDVLDASGKVLAHDPVQSSGNTARLTQPGLIDKPKRYLIRVTAQPGVIRLGGYYEIEITGASTFDGKTAGAGVQPEMSPELVHPMSGSLVTPSGPLVQPVGPLVHSVGPLVHPVGPLIHPVGALVNVQQNPHEYRLTLAADILFDFNQATIRPDAKEALDRVAGIIRTGSTGTTRIEGFTDAIGRPDYNLKLSTARAQAVNNWLVQQAGIPISSLSAQGFGASRFAAPNTKPNGADDPEGRQKNRRVELIIQRKS